MALANSGLSFSLENDNMSEVYNTRRPRGRGCGGGSGRIIIALVIAVISVISYFSSSQMNEVTGEKQYIKMDKDQEIALGLQAAPEMASTYGGESRDAQGRARVETVGNTIVANSDASKSAYPFKFHLLGDTDVINAFALPGGQIFITEALFSRLKTEGQLAGVLGHEVGHVVGRHGAEHLAKQQLTQGLAGAAVIASADPNNPQRSQANAMVAMAVAQLMDMKYGRSDELESDRLGVRFMVQAGYDPRAMIEVMEILRDAAKGPRQPEFFSTHPNPENRIDAIREAIEKEFPKGLPDGLKP